MRSDKLFVNLSHKIDGFSAQSRNYRRFRVLCRRRTYEKRHNSDSKDATVEDWNDPMANKFGLKAATRFGLGILRSNAIAKNDKHKNNPLTLFK